MEEKRGENRDSYIRTSRSCSSPDHQFQDNVPGFSDLYLKLGDLLPLNFVVGDQLDLLLFQLLPLDLLLLSGVATSLVVVHSFAAVRLRRGHTTVAAQRRAGSGRRGEVVVGRQISLLLM